MIEKIGGRDRDRTGDPCLQRRAGKILTALSGVAYTETDKILALSSVPKLYRKIITLTNPRQLQIPVDLASNVFDRSGTFSIDLFDGSARGEHVHKLQTLSRSN